MGGTGVNDRFDWPGSLSGLMRSSNVTSIRAVDTLTPAKCYTRHSVKPFGFPSCISKDHFR